MIEPWLVFHDSQWKSVGQQLIVKNKVAVVLLAGGQGTRLGSSKPKGMFDIGIGQSLFEMQATRLKESNLCWYIMTSDKTHMETVAFFEARQNFGVHVEFFQQGQLSSRLENGDIATDADGNPILSPNGNGGVYDALKKSGILAKMKSSGIEYVYIYGVDNVAVRIADPAFLGLVHTQKAECGLKWVPSRMHKKRVVCLQKKMGALPL